jgi:formylglycine-generating enzyme required for sulfatase activity
MTFRDGRESSGSRRFDLLAKALRSGLLAMLAVVWHGSVPTVVAAELSTQSGDPAPVPPAAEVKAARSKVTQELQEAVAATTTPSAKTKLLRSLLSESASADSSDAARYARLLAVRDLFVTHGEPELAVKAGALLARHFEVDPWEERREPLQDLAKSTIVPVLARVMETALRAMDEAIQARAFDAAQKLGESATQAVARTKDAELRKYVTPRVKEVAAIKKEWVRVESLTSKDPSTPEAKREFGLYLCVFEGHWDEGLALLAESDDEKLAELAKQELQGPATSNLQLDLGNAWFDAAAKRKGAIQSAFRSRAGHWFEKAMPAASEADWKKVSKRVLECPYQDGHRFLPRTITLALGPQAQYEMRLIPAGTFSMGQAGQGHEVTLTRPYYIGTTEVTHAQWLAVMKQLPTNHKGDPRVAVHGADWHGLKKFIDALQQTKWGAQYRFRLPTEAEWEYACRAGTTTDHPWGDSSELMSEHGWVAPDAGDAPRIVAQLKPNRYGLYDMLGNMWEWTGDFYEPYPPGPAVDPTGPVITTAIAVRGGSWLYSREHANSWIRRGEELTRKDHYFGFRFVCQIR